MASAGPRYLVVAKWLRIRASVVTHLCIARGLAHLTESAADSCLRSPRPTLTSHPAANPSDRQMPLPADGWLDLGPGWLFDSIRDAVVVADAETGRIALWNPFASELFGFTSDDVLGHALPDLIADLQEAPQWTAARAAGSGPDLVELFARRKDQSEVLVELTLSRLES